MIAITPFNISNADVFIIYIYNKMVEYIKTKKGYFYKLKKMVKKGYRKKNIKTRKNKKMVGGGKPIEKSDIMYQDDLVCILRPDVKKGVIVWTHYTQPPRMDSLCELGLKTGKQLDSEGVEFGRSKIHPYIFFRAPYYSRDIDYSTPETEIISSYGKREIGIKSRVFIRVDPDKTFVFSSEIRDVITHKIWYGKVDTIISNFKKSLSKYLEIINNNMKIKEDASLVKQYGIIYLPVKQYYFQLKHLLENHTMINLLKKIVKYLYQFHI